LTNEELIGTSEEMSKLKDMIQKVAATSSRIFITGESGSGKELVAKEIHRESDRSDQPFIHVNCATIPANMIEVELFGSVEGYLSYSPGKKIGKLQMADKGTLFLDEVSDLSLDAQGKLHN